MFAGALDDLAHRVAGAGQRQDQLRDALRHLSDWPDWPEADAIRLALARFDVTVESLHTRIDTVPDAVALAAELEAINAEIDAAIAQHRGTGGAGHGGSSSGAGMTADWQEAMLFFGFDLADTPTPELFKQRRRELEKRHHPSRPTGSDAAFQLYGTYCDLLMRQFGFAR